MVVLHVIQKKIFVFLRTRRTKSRFEAPHDGEIAVTRRSISRRLNDIRGKGLVIRASERLPQLTVALPQLEGAFLTTRFTGASYETHLSVRRAQGQ